MPKQKTRSSVAKRFTVTPSGKVKSAKMNKRHKLGNKSAKRKRNLRRGYYLKGEVANNIKRQMPY